MKGVLVMVTTKKINIVLLLAISVFLMIQVLAEVDLSKNPKYYAVKYEKESFSTTLEAFNNTVDEREAFFIYELLVQKAYNSQSEDDIYALSKIDLSQFEVGRISMVYEMLVEIYSEHMFYEQLAVLEEYAKYSFDVDTVMISKDLSDARNESATLSDFTNNLYDLGSSYATSKQHYKTIEVIHEIIELRKDPFTLDENHYVMSLLKKVPKEYITLNDAKTIVEHFIFLNDYYQSSNALDYLQETLGESADEYEKVISFSDFKHVSIHSIDDAMKFISPFGNSESTIYLDGIFSNKTDNSRHYEVVSGSSVKKISNFFIVFTKKVGSYSDVKKSYDMKNIYIVRENLEEINTVDNYQDIEHLVITKETGEAIVKGDLSVLENLPNLKIIDFEDATGITGELKSLANLKKLEYINLKATNVKGDLKDLSQLENLKYINVGYTTISGELVSIAKNKNLIEIHFDSTSCSSSYHTASSFKYLRALSTNATGDIISLKDLKYLNTLKVTGGDGDISILNKNKGLTVLRITSDTMTGNADLLDLPYLTAASYIKGENVEGVLIIKDYSDR